MVLKSSLKIEMSMELRVASKGTQGSLKQTYFDGTPSFNIECLVNKTTYQNIS